MNALGQTLTLLINTLGGLFLLALILRFMLQASRADFYNPVSQALVKITAPVVKPFRRVIPAWRNFDFATLLVALLVNTLATALMLVAGNIDLAQSGINPGTLVSWAFTGIVSFILNIYFYGLLISVIASWIAPYSGNPILILIHQLLEPIQSRFRKIIPPIGGLDLSPIFIFLAIQILISLVVGGLRTALGISNFATEFIIGV